MQGLAFSGKQQLSIKKSVKLINGSITITRNRILIDAYPGVHVAFQNVNINFRGEHQDCEEVGSIVIQGGKVQMDNCSIKGGGSQNSSGIELTGRACELSLTSCNISGFTLNQLHIYDGAHATVNQCEISNSELGDGVFVCGEDSFVQINNSKIHSIHGNCITSTNNAKAVLNKCQIYRSLEYVGLCADSCGQIEASNCRVHSTYRYSVSCQDLDSSVLLTECHIGQGYQYGLSLQVKDAGKIQLVQCKPLDGPYIMWAQTSSGTVVMQ
eukprot:TRINITY_DN14842_c0_g1_i1.p1 TRINITY_DN14842_c0_g1~~TRINITY_DN14842_c0_g1_i1.p1  ORF type:complete len:269 (+),score=20.00 TRINITY_DN14842_c0_g1_i1:82-888(+)